MLHQEEFQNGTEKICVVGLGYVGLPLATVMARNYRVLGFDVDLTRIEELGENIDRTKEVDSKTLKGSNIEFTDNPERISECKIIIVTVPTPIDEY